MRINGTSITMVRGDSEQINVSLTQDGAAVELVTGDTVYMTIRKSIAAAPNLSKTVTVFNSSGIAEIVLNPSDTKTMAYDEYMYDVQVKFADGTVKTVIPQSKFRLLAEVTI